jgi:hypothetical protein
MTPHKVLHRQSLSSAENRASEGDWSTSKI